MPEKELKVLKVKELISFLETYGADNDVIVFADGNLYPVLAVQKDLDGLPRVEIGCGWATLDAFLGIEKDGE